MHWEGIGWGVSGIPDWSVGRDLLSAGVCRSGLRATEAQEARIRYAKPHVVIASWR